jgi:hypothetical protein
MVEVMDPFDKIMKVLVGQTPEKQKETIAGWKDLCLCPECPSHPLTVEAEKVVTESGDKIRQLFIENPKAQAVFLEIIKELGKLPA